MQNEVEMVTWKCRKGRLGPSLEDAEPQEREEVEQGWVRQGTCVFGRISNPVQEKTQEERRVGTETKTATRNGSGRQIMED